MWSPLLHELLCYVIGLEVSTDKGRSGKEQSGGLHKDAGNCSLIVLVNGLANITKLIVCLSVLELVHFLVICSKPKRFKVDLSTNTIEAAIKNNSYFYPVN